jgi:hypothetical protein
MDMVEMDLIDLADLADLEAEAAKVVKDQLEILVVKAKLVAKGGREEMVERAAKVELEEMEVRATERQVPE